MEKTSFLKRRWSDFRNGHGIYLAFLLGFSNFILISYKFFVSELFPMHLWQFVVLFIAVYIPGAIFLGHWHRKTQLPIEERLAWDYSPTHAKYQLLGWDNHLLMLTILDYLLAKEHDAESKKLRLEIREMTARISSEREYFRQILEKVRE